MSQVMVEPGLLINAPTTIAVTHPASDDVAITSSPASRKIVNVEDMFTHLHLQQQQQQQQQPHSIGIAQAKANGNDGPWLCHVCGNINKEKRTRCNMAVCQAPKGFPGPFNEVVLGTPSPELVATKWRCSVCQDVNRGRRETCYRTGCSGTRQTAMQLPPKGRLDDGESLCSTSEEGVMVRDGSAVIGPHAHAHHQQPPLPPTPGTHKSITVAVPLPVPMNNHPPHGPMGGPTPSPIPPIFINPSSGFVGIAPPQPSALGMVPRAGWNGVPQRTGGSGMLDHPTVVVGVCPGRAFGAIQAPLLPHQHASGTAPAATFASSIPSAAPDGLYQPQGTFLNGGGAFPIVGAPQPYAAY